jgi:hypothetical protein
LLILQNIHLNDNETYIPRFQPGYDPIHKVRPFVDRITEKFRSIYTPDREISFDEGLCPYKGRLRFKVYNPAKPNKFGIKLYQVCESKSGYCCAFEIYTGQIEAGDKEILSMIHAREEGLNVDEQSSKTQSLVVGLLASCDLLHKGYHIYMDNYYTSPKLFDLLVERDTGACGTLRSNRKEVPLAIRKKIKMAADDVVFRRRDDLLIVKYHDKRDIVVASTIHKAQGFVLNKNREDDLPIVKPTCIYDYIRMMGGVDISDQILQYYTVIRKTVKW